MQYDAKDRVKHLLEDTNLVPRALIILGRTLNILRANNKVHSSVVNRVAIMADYAAIGLRHHNTPGGLSAVATPSTWRERVASNWDYLLFKAQLFLLAVVYQYTQVQQRVQRFFGGRGDGFEDLLEKGFARTVETKLGFTINTDHIEPEMG